MPIRFQVDPDFYDHPKVLSMSDAAFALWVRAGSYCAAKHTDGFVADDVLSLFSTTQQDAAPELVTRRLWRRVKGGFRFHQYEERNLTKARVDADREYDRARKRRARAEKSSRPPVDNPDDRDPGNRDGTQDRPENVRSVSGKLLGQTPNSEPVDNSQDPDTERPATQVNGKNVRTGHPPDSGPESERNPNRSVSVSVSGSVSGSGHAPPPAESAGPPTHEPPPRCPEHSGDEYPPPCGKCADARRRHEAWERAATSRRQHGAALPPSTTAAKCGAHIGQPAHNCALCRADQLAGDIDHDR